MGRSMKSLEELKEQALNIISSQAEGQRSPALVSPLGQIMVMGRNATDVYQYLSYQSGNHTKNNGWFYCLQKQLMESCFLGKEAVQAASERLIDEGILMREKRGIPPKYFYCINRNLSDPFRQLCHLFYFVHHSIKFIEQESEIFELIHIYEAGKLDLFKNKRIPFEKELIQLEKEFQPYLEKEKQINIRNQKMIEEIDEMRHERASQSLHQRERKSPQVGLESLPPLNSIITGLGTPSESCNDAADAASVLHIQESPPLRRIQDYESSDKEETSSKLATPVKRTRSTIPPPPRQQRPAKPIDPLVEYWNNLPHTPKHKDTTTNTYEKILKHLHSLRNGKIGSPQYPINTDFKKRYNISTRKHTHPWKDNSIKKAMDIMNLWYSPEYAPENKNYLPKNLADVIYSDRNGTSHLLAAVSKHPETKNEMISRRVVNTLSDSEKTDVEMVMDTWLKLAPSGSAANPGDTNRIIAFVRHVNEYWEGLGKTLKNRLWRRFPSAFDFLGAFCLYVEDLHNNSKLDYLSTHWLKEDSDLWRRWLVHESRMSGLEL